MHARDRAAPGGAAREAADEMKVLTESVKGARPALAAERERVNHGAVRNLEHRFERAGVEHVDALDFRQVGALVPRLEHAWQHDHSESLLFFAPTGRIVWARHLGHE